jgi:hypothetical protein
VYVLLKTVALGKLCIDWGCHKVYVNNKGMAPNQKFNPRHVSTMCCQKPEKVSYFLCKKANKWNKAKHNIHHNLSWGWLLNHQAHSFVCILLMTGRKWGMEGVNCQPPPHHHQLYWSLWVGKWPRECFALEEVVHVKPCSFACCTKFVCQI